MESNWKFVHVAVVVRDMDKMVEYLEDKGIATLRSEFILDSNTYSGYTVYGKPAESRHRSSFKHYDIGPDKFDLELISPTEGTPIFVDFLKNQGEGIHHIAFTVDDLEAEIAKLTAKGIPVITRVKRDGGGFAYFDTGKEGGNFIVELIQVRKQ